MKAAAKPVRVNPSTLGVESLQPLAPAGGGPRGRSSISPGRPIVLSRMVCSSPRTFACPASLDGEKLGGHVRVNEDRPTSHSFEGMAVTPEGTVVMAWIDSREGPERGRDLDGAGAGSGHAPRASVKLDGRHLCLLSRWPSRGGPGDTVAVLWRKVFPGDIRDMVLGLSRDGGARAARARGWTMAGRSPPARIAGARWRWTVKGKVYAAWYTEGRQEVPSMFLATSTDGRRFGAPIQASIRPRATIPDQVRLAVNPAGRWSSSGRTLPRSAGASCFAPASTAGAPSAPVQTLSKAVKAFSPGRGGDARGRLRGGLARGAVSSLKTVVQLRAGGP